MFTNLLIPPADCSDAEFLRALRWTGSAGSDAATAAKHGNVAAFSAAVADLLETARDHSYLRSARHASNGAKRPLRAAAELNGSSGKASARKPKARSSKSAVNGKALISNRPHTGFFGRDYAAAEALLAPKFDAMEFCSPRELAVCVSRLPRFAIELEPESFFKVWRRVLAAATHLLAQPRHADDVLADEHVAWLGLLPWTVGVIFHGLEEADRLRNAGMAGLTGHLLRQTDHDGVPSAELLPVLPRWLESLVRADALSVEFKKPLWIGPVIERMCALAAQLARLRGPHGQSPLCDLIHPVELASLSEFQTIAARLAEAIPHEVFSGNGSGRRIANLKLNGNGHGAPNGKSGGRRAGIAEYDLGAAFHSPEARVAILRSDMTRQADRLCVAYHADFPLLDLATAEGTILRGDWEIEVTVDGRPVLIEGEWNCACWCSDEDVDYLELQWLGEADLRIERQVLLSRGGNFAILADTVAVTGGERIDYVMRLPSAPGVAIRPGKLTRECRLRHPRQIVRAFPLALPQSRLYSTPGTFGPQAGALELRQSAAGSGVYAPLVLDWSPARRTAAAEWRTLTVTEERGVVPGDRAAGHRLRIAGHQLLVYHGLAGTSETRAVLGHNTRHETVIGLIGESGDVAPLLSIEC